MTWPNQNERKRIAKGTQEQCGLPNGVGIVDRTLFPLSFWPQQEDAPDYKGRKHFHSLSGVIVCDHEQLTQCYIAGWPGCTHDNHIARNTDVWKHPERWFVVSAFTAPPRASMNPDQLTFNSAMSQARVTLEHTINLHKGHFLWPRSIHKVITEEKSSLCDLLLFMDACIVIHHFLAYKQLDEAKELWFNNDDHSNLDDYERTPSNNELNEAIPQNADPDFRGTQLMHHMEETGYKLFEQRC